MSSLVQASAELLLRVHKNRKCSFSLASSHKQARAYFIFLWFSFKEMIDFDILKVYSITAKKTSFLNFEIIKIKSMICVCKYCHIVNMYCSFKDQRK